MDSDLAEVMDYREGLIEAESDSPTDEGARYIKLVPKKYKEFMTYRFKDRNMMIDNNSCVKKRKP